MSRLEDFGEDKVADRDRLGGEELVKEICLWSGLSVKVVNTLGFRVRFDST